MSNEAKLQQFYLVPQQCESHPDPLSHSGQDVEILCKFPQLGDHKIELVPQNLHSIHHLNILGS